MEEEDLSLYILVDVSKSCDYGNPNKALYLKRVAAALGYIGLVNYNRVNVVAMASGIVAETGALRGRRRVAQMIDFVEQAQADRRIAFRRCVQAIRAGQSAKGRAASSSRIFTSRMVSKTA